MTTLIALCADLGELAGCPPDIEVSHIADLCDHPARLTDVADGATALVVGLCNGGVSRREIQSIARRLGLDALGVQFLDIAATTQAPERLRALAVAAARRAEQFAGSRPEHAKPTFPATLGRRSFLRLPLPEYVAVPAVEQRLCAAGEGCVACMSVCPNDAYAWTSGHVEVDPSRCEPCGRCLTACPTGAAHNPALTPAQLEAEVRAIVSESDEPRGITFVCSRSSEPETTPGWFPVALPCTGMLTAGWVLAPLLLGATGVAVRPCSDGGCALGNDDLAAAAVDLGRQLLELLGLDSRRLGLAPGELADDALPTCDNLAVFTALGEHQVVRALVEVADVAGGAGPTRLAHSAAHMGQVQLGEACTLCGACATGCPTEALVFSHHGADASLSFDAARCTACEQCVSRCPEQAAGAISVEHVIDLAGLTAGSTRLLRDDLASCVACGKPFSTERLLDHVASLLGDEHATMFADVRGRCLDCRATMAGVR